VASQLGWQKVIFVDIGTEFTLQGTGEWAFRRGAKVNYTRPGKPSLPSVALAFLSELGVKSMFQMKSMLFVRTR
jgi:hypothetical protein